MTDYITTTIDNINRYKNKSSLLYMIHLLHYIKRKHSEKKYGFIQKSIYKRI